MKITYALDGNDANPLTLTPSLAVIACDPRSLRDVMSFTPQESLLFDALQNFTFYTATLRVYPVRKQDMVVILDPLICEKMNGDVHGYRNETAKQFGLDKANSVLSTHGTNLITTYQQAGADQPVSLAEMQEKLENFLQNPPTWWPFAIDKYEIVQVEEVQGHDAPHRAVNPLFTPYFNHFPSSQLADGYPWHWFEEQGLNNTVYVHASTYFESALHSWNYITQLLSQKGTTLLPADTSAQIAIIGAGVTGLLCAYQLRQRGYDNVILLEKTNRYGGKTHSLRVPDQDAITICELGTCYMSYAYNDMLAELSQFTQGNERVTIASWTDRGIAYNVGNEEQVMDYLDYGLMYASQQLGYSWPLSTEDHIKVIADLGLLIAAYTLIHQEVFLSLGNNMPIPQPANDPFGLYTKTFGQFLQDNNMAPLIGFLQYAYEVQGYGDLNHIPAYYGLVWVSPEMIEPFGKTAGVTGFTKGWEDVWIQLVEKLNLNIQLNANVLKIERV